MQASLRKPVLQQAGLFNAQDNLAFLASPPPTVGTTQTPTLTTGWTNTPGANPAGFRTEENGATVRILGSITSSSSGNPSPTVVFTLPAGYRPSQSLAFAFAGSGAAPATGLFNINSSGQVNVLTSWTGVGAVSLEGITFQIPQS